MSDQAGVADVLPFGDVHDIDDMGIEIDFLISLLNRCERSPSPVSVGGKYLIAFLLQQVRNTSPNPSFDLVALAVYRDGRLGVTRDPGRRLEGVEDGSRLALKLMPNKPANSTRYAP